MKKVIIAVFALLFLTSFWYASENIYWYVVKAKGGLIVGKGGTGQGGSFVAESNTNVQKIDSICEIDGKLYAFVGADTTGWGVLTADQVDGGTLYVKHRPDTIQKTANFTIDFDDLRKDYMCVKATSIVITIPAAASEAIPIGTTINFYGEGAGIMVFKAAANVHLHSDKDSIATSRQHQVVGLKKRGNNYWILYGALTD